MACPPRNASDCACGVAGGGEVGIPCGVGMDPITEETKRARTYTVLGAFGSATMSGSSVIRYQSPSRPVTSNTVPAPSVTTIGYVTPGPVRSGVAASTTRDCACRGGCEVGIPCGVGTDPITDETKRARTYTVLGAFESATMLGLSVIRYQSPSRPVASKTVPAASVTTIGYVTPGPVRSGVAASTTRTDFGKASVVACGRDPCAKAGGTLTARPTAASIAMLESFTGRPRFGLVS